MYPYFAMGHLTPFLHFSNKLAERGHKISFFIPTKTQEKLEALNLHPDLISFVPVTVPSVEGLPVGAETTADVHVSKHHLVMAAMDLTKPAIVASLQDLKPHIIFFDFSHWLPALTRELNIKSIHFCIINPATIGFLVSPERKLIQRDCLLDAFMEPPPGFPVSSSIKIHMHEAQVLAFISARRTDSDLPFLERLFISFSECDAMAFKTCREMEGPYIDYVEKQFKKPAFLAGPVIPEQPTSALEEKWAKWLDNFGAKTVIFCSFGSECIMEKEQFQELVLGFELTGLPFFAALKPPVGAETVEAALPDGFAERVKGRGVVHGGWVQQQLILKHPSVGCFVSHCGSGSLSEAMVNECQLVLLPNIGDQVINARFMGGDLKVGVEVEKGEEDGLFNKDGVCKAVRSVMDGDSEIGKEVRDNHGKWREFLLSKGLENSYIHTFVQNLQALLLG